MIRRQFASEKESNIAMRHAFWDVPGNRPGFTLVTKTPEQVGDRPAKGSFFFGDILSKGLEIYAA